MFESLEPPLDPGDLSPEELEAWLGLDETGDGVGYGVSPDPGLEAAAAEALDELETAEASAHDDDLDADAILAEAAGNKNAERRVQARRLWLACQWADRHAVLTTGDREGPVNGWSAWVGTAHHRWRSSHRPSSVPCSPCPRRL